MIASISRLPRRRRASVGIAECAQRRLAIILRDALNDLGCEQSEAIAHEPCGHGRQRISSVGGEWDAAIHGGDHVRVSPPRAWG